MKTPAPAGGCGVRLLLLLLLLGLGAGVLEAADPLPDLRSIPPDLTTPAMVEGGPLPGRRVRQTLPGYAGTNVYHALYLPADWQPGRKYPVICEYAGNGIYTNRFGDFSAGTVEGSNLGYGISGGRGFIWLCLPYVARTTNGLANTRQWWGDVAETLRYAHLAVAEVCAHHGGDTGRLVLAGFSRGAIGVNYLGLHNDQVAPLWRAFIAHSHYDGVRTNWPYAGADPASAGQRLRRLNGRPQFISQEGSVDATRRYLEASGVRAPFTFVPLPYRNHTDEWVLRPIPERERLRRWLAEVLAAEP